MVKKRDSQTELCRIFKRKKCYTIDELTKKLNYSQISTRRFLKQAGYYSSYTHNSKWYTLKSIPNFSKRGIWFYQNIGFSLHGNLTQTILHFIDSSTQGLTVKELYECLAVPCYTILNLMSKRKQIERLKTVNGFVYLSIDFEKKQKQTSLRVPLPSDTEAVLILVEFIKHPDYSILEIASTLTKQGIPCESDTIERLFSHHNLKKKVKCR